MVDLIPVLDILAQKKGKYKEAHLILFEKCNLRCSFCHQDHDSRVGMTGEDILTKVDKLLESTPKDVPYVVNFTGGELFTDDIPEWLFGYYLLAGQKVLDHFDEVKLVWGTNLAYEDISRVRRLILALREYAPGRIINIATSYDPAGRFDKASRKLFFRNVAMLQKYIDTVNVVITKQNIQSFLEGKEGDEMAWLVENFTVYFDHYIPSTMYEYIQPDEDIISDLYLLLNQKYPNSLPVRDWRENLFNETTCRSTKIVNKDNVVTTCWSEAGKNSILDEEAGLDAKAKAEAAFIEKYNCLACEYYGRCGLRCFLHHSFIAEGLSDECRIKEMFDRIVPRE